MSQLRLRAKLAQTPTSAQKARPLVTTATVANSSTLPPASVLSALPGTSVPLASRWTFVRLEPSLRLAQRSASSAQRDTSVSRARPNPCSATERTSARLALRRTEIESTLPF